MNLLQFKLAVPSQPVRSGQCIYVWVYKNGVEEIAPSSNVFLSPETVFKVDGIKIIRNASLFYFSAIFSSFSCSSLFFLRLRSREIMVNMGDLVQSRQFS